MSGDHVVVTKSGQMRYGLERLFSSLSGKAGPGRCLLSLARLSVKRRTSYPVMPEPVAQPSAALGHEPSKTKARGRRGRPPGSQKRHRREGALSPSLRCIPEHSKRWLEQIGDAFKVVDFLFAGELGHHDAMQMVSQVGLHLLSQLRYHSALSCPSEGPYWGRGPRRQDGQKVAYHHLPSPY
jgi:putative transposase